MELNSSVFQLLLTPTPDLTSGHHDLECATCSIISVLTQWGATLVIQLREGEGEGEGEGESKRALAFERGSGHARCAAGVDY